MFSHIDQPWTYLKTTEILYQVDERFHTKVRKSNLSCLLTVQNTHRRALLFIDNRQFIGFLHEQIWAVSTDVNLLGLDENQGLLTIKAKVKLGNFFFLLFGRDRLAKSPQACGKRRETLKSWNAAISKYIQLVFCCVMEKLLDLQHVWNAEWSNVELL